MKEQIEQGRYQVFSRVGFCWVDATKEEWKEAPIWDRRVLKGGNE
ncbi:MAG: hypothetical protein ACTSXD_11665 [Candidatus Heimdallarchaeaceae archaeon]